MRRRGLSGLAVATALSAVPVDAQVAAPPPPPLIPPAQIDNTLEVAGAPVRARVLNSRMTVPVFINGQGPFRFLIDTGADRSVIGSAAARQLGLELGGRVRMHHVAGSTLIGTVTIASLRVGSNEVIGIQAPALPEEYLGAQGIMGIDALREQLIAMDFDNRTITIQDPRRPDRATSEAGEIVVTGRRRKGQLILTALQIGPVALDAVIDTGTQMTIGNTVLLDKLFASRNRPPATSVNLYSVTGQIVPAQMIVVPRITLGTLTIRNVPIAFVDSPPFRLFGLARRPAVLLGNDVLESFKRVTLDFRRRKVRFVLRK